MNNEFKKSKSNNETRYTLESMTAGATGSGSIATSVGSVGKVQKRGNILAQEAGKDKVDASKPRNFVAKNAKMGGAGAHKDKKKEQKQGAEKHKKPYMEALKQKIEDLKSKLNEAQVVVEGKEDKIAQLKKDHETAVHWSKNETSPQKREAARQKAEKIKRHLDTQYKQGAAEGISGLGYDAQSLITKLRRDVEEKRLRPTPEAVLAAARELAGDMEFAPQLLVKQVLGQSVAEGGEENRQWSNKDMERLRVATRDFDDIMASDGPDQTKHDLIKKRIQTKPIAGPKGQLPEQGVAEGAIDFVGDSIEALRSSVPGLKQQDFLDELYMYIENQYGQRAAEMMSNAGQDDYDDWYDSYLDNPEQGMAEVDTYMESLAESLQEVLSEKAVSKKQQKFMGMVHAAQKGEKPASKEVAKVAKDMGKKDAKDFAATKHKGLPEKKKSKK